MFIFKKDTIKEIVQILEIKESKRGNLYREIICNIPGYGISKNDIKKFYVPEIGKYEGFYRKAIISICPIFKDKSVVKIFPLKK